MLGSEANSMGSKAYQNTMAGSEAKQWEDQNKEESLAGGDSSIFDPILSF